MIGSVIDSVGGVVDRFIQTDDERAQFKLALEKTLQKRDSEVEQTIRAELQAKERVMVAEMAQGDNYTKRARPSVIYFGLVVIAFNYCLIPLVQLFMGLVIEPFALPTEFWFAWSGAVSVYSLGRSMEKRGVRNRFTEAVHGQSQPSLLD
jgi:hypothetical protein